MSKNTKIDTSRFTPQQLFDYWRIRMRFAGLPVSVELTLVYDGERYAVIPVGGRVPSLDAPDWHDAQSLATALDELTDTWFGTGKTPPTEAGAGLRSVRAFAAQGAEVHRAD